MENYRKIKAAKNVSLRLVDDGFEVTQPALFDKEGKKLQDETRKPLPTHVVMTHKVFDGVELSDAEKRLNADPEVYNKEIDAIEEQIKTLQERKADIVALQSDIKALLKK